MRNNGLNNPLYFFIKDQNIESFLARRDYFIVHISGPDHFINIYPDKRVDQHLRVDAKYHEGHLTQHQSRYAHLSPAHYTERYFNDDDSEFAVFHVYFNHKQQVIGTTLHINQHKVPLSATSRAHCIANSVSAKQILSNAQIKLDQFVEAIDFRKIQVLQNTVSQMIERKDIDNLIKYLPKLTHSLEQYDIYTFGSPTHHTIYYRQLLNDLLMSKGVFNAEEPSLSSASAAEAEVDVVTKSLPAAMTLEEPPSVDEAQSHKVPALTSIQVMRQQLEALKSWAARLPVQGSDLLDYAALLNRATVFLLTCEPQSKSEKKVYQKIQQRVNQMPPIESLFYQAIFSYDVPLLDALMVFYERQIPVLIFSTFSQLLDLEKYRSEHDEPLSLSLRHIFSQFPSDPRYHYMFEDVSLLIDDLRVNIKQILVLKEFSSTFSVIMECFPMIGNFCRNSQFSILDSLVAMEPSDPDIQFRMLHQYISSGAPLRFARKINACVETQVGADLKPQGVSSHHRKKFSHSTQAAGLFAVHGKHYDENLLGLLFEETFKIQPRKSMLSKRQMDELSQAYVLKAGASQVIDQIKALFEKHDLQLFFSETVIVKNARTMKKYEEGRHCFLSFLKAANRIDPTLVHERFPLIACADETGHVMTMPR